MAAKALKPRVKIQISSKALKSNYKKIQAIVPSQKMLPMIKANGYGHGLKWACQTLIPLKPYAFGVATLNEAAEVRKILGDRSRTPIIAFSGGIPWNEETGQFCQKFGIRPVIASLNDLKSFFRRKWETKIPYDLKIDSGMNRLGIPVSDIHPAFDICKKRFPTSVLTHLAVGENPKHPVSRFQKRIIRSIHHVFKNASNEILFHFANSAGIWNHEDWELEHLSDLVRPGISLYGARPWPEAPNQGLRPVMKVLTRIIDQKTLKKGDMVGYGATYQAKKSQKIAILPIGYGDGLHRILSNRGIVSLGKQKTRFLGIISMDLSAVGATQRTRVGDWVELWGSEVDIWEQALNASTIPYELLTSASIFDPTRVQRIYG